MLIKSYDGNSFGTDYVVVIEDGQGIALPDVVAQMARRIGAHPLLSGIERQGKTFPLGIAIEGSDEKALRLQLFQWLDPEDEDAKQLVATDDDGSSNERYLACICERLSPVRGKGGIIPRLYVASMKVSDDVRWRSTSEVTESTWNITASGQTKVVNNQGEDEAYLVFTVEPTSAKAAGFLYKRWCPVIWNATAGITNYPMMLGPSNLTGYAQADGDDVRVYVDGVEKDRWLGGTLVSAVKVWVNLDFDAYVVAEVGTAIAASGDVDEIESSLDISDFPSSGILLIGSEAFVYTGKSNVDKTFTGVTRAAKLTSMAAHGVGATIDLVQHDVWMYYGDSSLSAPTTDDTYKPPFDLDTSTNTSWDFDATGSNCDGFGRDGGLCAGQWAYTEAPYGGSTNYADYFHQGKGDRGDKSTTPWTEIGIVQEGGAGDGGYGMMTLYNPCGITAANFQSGENYEDADLTSWLRSSVNGSSWTTEYTIPDPGTPSTWDTWSQNLSSLTTGTLYIQLRLRTTTMYSAYSNIVECSDVVVTLNSTYTPDVTINSQQANYQLEATITNQTTGKAITLSFGMELNEELEIDTAQKTVTYLADGSGQRQALSTVGVRKAWLALDPGNNTLRYDETGAVAVTVEISYRKRYYS